MRIIIVLAFLVACSLSSPLEKKNNVHLTLFYESLCPYCQAFILNQLSPVWSELKEHITLDMVPYGNAHQAYVKGHWTFTCQHGTEECVGNKLEACAIHTGCSGKTTPHCPKQQLALVMEYITCLEKSQTPETVAKECAKQSNLDHGKIEKCYNGKLGERLENRYGNQTDAFKNPPKTYVPYIIINGKHTEEQQTQAENDLKSVLCQYIKC